ncbi:uncharacterized protein LOC135291926 [Passer domesticus]|uniref:uncharacterized protein LOC135291926 n=1 Tax=Passer domesticus TaxID=48849 RepID=UPI0030FF16FD
MLQSSWRRLLHKPLSGRPREQPFPVHAHAHATDSSAQEGRKGLCMAYSSKGFTVSSTPEGPETKDQTMWSAGLQCGAMSPTLAFILALLFTPSGLKADMKIDKDAVRRIREREEFLHREMTRLLREVDDNNSIMESLLLSVRQLLWLPWLTIAGQKGNPAIEKNEAERMQERKEYLQQEMTRLLQEIDGNNSIMESFFLCLWQLLWLPLLPLAFWLVTRWKCGSARHSTQEESISKMNIVRVKFSSKEKVSEHEKDKGADRGGSILAVPSPFTNGQIQDKAGGGCEQTDLIGNVPPHFCGIKLDSP